MKDAELRELHLRGPTSGLGLLTRINAPLARRHDPLRSAACWSSSRSSSTRCSAATCSTARPTWTENLALVLVLYVTLIGAAVGVRDAGHIGMESLLVLVPGPHPRTGSSS